MELTVKNDGKVELKGEGWKPDQVRFINIEFRGKVGSNYKYPINPTDGIKEIVVRVE